MPKDQKVKRKPNRAPYAPPVGFKRAYQTLAAAIEDIMSFGNRRGHQLTRYSWKYASTKNGKSAWVDRVPVTSEQESYISLHCGPTCPTTVHARRTRRAETHLGPVIVTVHGPQQCARAAAAALDAGDAADVRPAPQLHDDEAKTDASEEEDAGAAFEPALSDNEHSDEDEADATQLNQGGDEDDDQARAGGEPRASDDEDENDPPNQNVGPQELEKAIQSLREELKNLRGDQKEQFVVMSSRFEGSRSSWRSRIAPSSQSLTSYHGKRAHRISFICVSYVR